jgi:AcrR family transcriptional regulator
MTAAKSSAAKLSAAKPDDRPTRKPASGLHRPTPKSSETRARIVAGALLALERNGIGETTTRKIAQAAQINLATLHYHFHSKEAVLLAVLDALVAELTLTLRETTERSALLEDRIAGVVETAWAYAERTRDKQIVQFELTLYALRTKGSEWLAARQYDAYISAYAGLLSDGITPALPVLRARELARFILAGIDGLILQRLAGASQDEARAGVASLIAGTQAHAKES